MERPRRGAVRIDGLDAWRSGLMLGGLLVHGSATLGQATLFTAIDLVSQAFRMGAFFALSGFLTALALARHPDRAWLGPRLRRLGIPALTGMFLLSPLIRLLHQLRPTEAIDRIPLPFEWHHMWFLWGLMLCSIAAVIADRIDRERALARWLTRRVTPSLALLVTALATALCFAVVPVGLRLVAPSALILPLANAQLIAGYLPTFLFGFLLARSAPLRCAAIAQWRLAGGIVLLTGAAHLAFLGGYASAWEDEIRFLGAALCPPAAFVLILRSALGVRRVPRAVRALSDASYTIYLVHVPLALAINVAMARIGLPAYAQFALTVIAAGALSWGLHVALVRRSALFTLLFNGKERDRPRSVDEARDDVAVAAADLHARA